MRLAQRMILGVGSAALVALALGACKARENQAAAGAGGEGGSASGVENVAFHPFTGDPAQAQRGRYLFVEYNCYGCHGGLAGGAMGPSLRDTTWKFGGSDEQVYASIRDGRPNGMPAWGNTLSEAQIRDIIGYIRSMRTTAEPKFFFINAQLRDSLGVQ
jgi:mono/diheme cytochrome c family protein